MMMPMVTGPLAMAMAMLPPGDGDPASGKGPEWGEAAPVGLLVWLLLGLALFLLIKSLNRHLKRVPASFEHDEPADPDVPLAAPVADGDGGGGSVTASGGTDSGDGGPGNSDHGAGGDTGTHGTGRRVGRH